MLFTLTDPTDTDARALTAALDADLVARYPKYVPGSIDAAKLVEGGGVFLVGRLAGRAVACGGLRPLEDGVMEVKRMYVDPGVRRQGVARALLGELERLARLRGSAIVRIETGNRQPEAIALYERAGYVRIPPFGEYAGNRYSACFEKTLSGGSGS